MSVYIDAGTITSVTTPVDLESRTDSDSGTFSTVTTPSVSEAQIVYLPHLTSSAVERWRSVDYDVVNRYRARVSPERFLADARTKNP